MGEGGGLLRRERGRDLSGLADGDVGGAAEVLAGDALDGGRHRGREHEGLPVPAKAQEVRHLLRGDTRRRRGVGVLPARASVWEQHQRMPVPVPRGT